MRLRDHSTKRNASLCEAAMRILRRGEAERGIETFRNNGRAAYFEKAGAAKTSQQRPMLCEVRGLWLPRSAP